MLSDVKEAIREIKAVATARTTNEAERMSVLGPIRACITQHIQPLCIEHDTVFVQQLLDGGLVEYVKEFLKPIVIGSHKVFLPAADREMVSALSIWQLIHSNVYQIRCSEPSIQFQ